MTGWRLGYLIAPASKLSVIQKLQQNFFICAGSVAQWAGVAALREAGPDVERMRQTYDKRRRFRITSYNVCYTKLLRLRNGAPASRASRRAISVFPTPVGPIMMMLCVLMIK